GDRLFAIHDNVFFNQKDEVICSGRGYDFVFQGVGGMMSITGEKDDLPGGGPQKVGIALADIVTGMYSTIAILAAINHRNKSGEGQHIDMSLLDSIVALGSNQITGYFASDN